VLIYATAFLVGAITAISPCAYPVLPIVFAV
jgi:cytochrome c biogenesis protein CcdA